MSLTIQNNLEISLGMAKNSHPKISVDKIYHGLDT